jgi:hypothetical protein
VKDTPAFIFSGKPHIVSARNVVAYWLGRDRPGVEAALYDLR